MKKVNVLMIGPARSVKGGMTSVVDNYFNLGLDKLVNLKYIETVNDKNKLSKIIKMVKGYIEYKKCIKFADVVHVHMASRASTFRKGYYMKLAKKYGKKVVLHAHGGEFKKFYNNECNKNKQNTVNKILNLADTIIVLSEEWKEFYGKLVDKNKIQVIYNAIVLPEDFKKDVNTQNMLFLGRFGSGKGIYDIIPVMEQLVVDYPNCILYAGGDGEVPQVKQMVKEKKLEKNVKILGWVKGEQKEKLLKECTFYLLPSYNEGMPMALIEAMAYKNVSISTDVGGIPQVINNMENGIMIKPGDRNALLQNIKMVFEDKALREKLSENARKTVEQKFDINKNIKKLLEIYNNYKG